MSKSNSTSVGTESPEYDRLSSASANVAVGSLIDLLRRHVRLLVFGPLVAGTLTLGGTYVISPTFTATTTFLPPQQSQSAAASTLASLSSLASLAGGAVGTRSPTDQYVALMQSVTVSDRIIDQFKLMEVYRSKFRKDAQLELGQNVRFTVGKKDGLVTIEVDDGSPQRAADIANRYVDELRRMTASLAVTEAQQRRVFFERHLQASRDQLVKAQQDLQASGFNSGALKAEPKAAAEAYAKLKAEATAAEVRLQTLRGSLADGTAEVQQQLASVNALHSMLAKAEQAADARGGVDYVGKYREFKYQETLFDLYARQFELARLDESREGALIQVIDAATPPEKKSRPKRAQWALFGALAALVGLFVGLLVRPTRRARR